MQTLIAGQNNARRSVVVHLALTLTAIWVVLIGLLRNTLSARSGYRRSRGNERCYRE
ncbi:MAG: hypothetical protein U0452_09825 [Anaerolineae bacterium]